MSTRRKFIKKALVGSAGFFIVPRHVLGRGFVAPSDKLGIAAIGIGGRGTSNLTNSFASNGANIVALCDVDDRRAKPMREQFSEAPYMRDYRDMLEKHHKDIDAVIVSSADHMHYSQCMAAMDLGKHMYIEKPLTHDIWEARKLTEMAANKKLVTQMGNQGASGDGTRWIDAVVQEGIIGEVKEVHAWTNRPVWPQGIPVPKDTMPVPKEIDWNLWLGTAPWRAYHEAFMPTRWRGYWDYGTGALGDMGCHLIDVPFRALKLGYPTSVECSITNTYKDFFEEVVYDETPPASSVIHLEFPKRGNMPAIELHWYDGGIEPERPDLLPANEPLGDWGGGVIMKGSKGILIFGTYGSNPKVFLNDGSEVPEVKNMASLVDNGMSGHQAQWINACKEGYGAYTSSPLSQAGPLTETVLMGNLAIRSALLHEKVENRYNFPGRRKKLLWDGENMNITNFDMANQFIKRDYRTGW
ncbi:Gfo/Idh/MocA family oxidoreductase [Flavobacteriaceae bacterium]|nr:Gfo/Idh/MocA family oxidoreductase [Flavobacteriaceae bacterium]MDB9781267.1 Gfo/Idh/MocA family oxidoreductase [Flavobacteriaceae bacterium]